MISVPDFQKQPVCPLVIQHSYGKAITFVSEVIYRKLAILQLANLEITKGYPSTSELIMWTQVASAGRSRDLSRLAPKAVISTVLG